MFNKDAEKMTPNDTRVLNTLACILRPAGYIPAVGELARIADLPRGVCDRCLQKLCKRGYVECVAQEKGRVKFRFTLTQKGIHYVVDKGQVF